MSKMSIECELDHYFEHNIHVARRTLYLGSHSAVDGTESGVDYEMFASFLKGLTFLDSMSADPITIHLSTDGGDYYHGMAIYNAIRASRCYVTIIAWGYACSMGAIILQAADERLLTRDCVVMIHDGPTSMSGDSKAFEAWGRYSGLTRKAIYRLYRDRMRDTRPITMAMVEKLCSTDRIFSATQAVNMGLADCVLGDFWENTDAANPE